jgi:hypothetical protein
VSHHLKIVDEDVDLAALKAVIHVRFATRVALPSFLSSVTISSEFVLQLLPPRLHSSSGGNNLQFTDAVYLWRQQAGRDQPPKFINLAIF